VKLLGKRKSKMSQAKTLTHAEIEQVLAYIATRRFALRNRVMLLMGLWSGVRVASIANLLVGDVLNDDGTVKAEVRLRGAQIKGGKPQTVFLPQKLQVELQRYMDIRRVTDMTHPLFVTAGAKAFSPNVLAQHFFWLYKKAGIAGASSHSSRRTFITNLAAKGVSVRVLASLANHSSISVTQRYIDCNDDMKRNAVEMI
jgi:integrase/recombinase XerD